MNHSEIVSFLWGVADLIRDTFVLSVGPRTRFLPFNRGKFGGAANPPVFVRSGPGKDR